MEGYFDEEGYFFAKNNIPWWREEEEMNEGSIDVKRFWFVVSPMRKWEYLSAIVRIIEKNNCRIKNKMEEVEKQQRILKNLQKQNKELKAALEK